MRGLTVTCLAGDIARSSVRDPVTGETPVQCRVVWAAAKGALDAPAAGGGER